MVMMVTTMMIFYHAVYDIWWIQNFLFIILLCTNYCSVPNTIMFQQVKYLTRLTLFIKRKKETTTKPNKSHPWIIKMKKTSSIPYRQVKIRENKFFKSTFLSQSTQFPKAHPSVCIPLYTRIELYNLQGSLRVNYYFIWPLCCEVGRAGRIISV